MRNFFYSALLFAGICGFSACSNGDYIANPSNGANGAVNPITPLTSAEYTWGGDEPLSADINGSHWKADDISFGLDTSGANVIIATKGHSFMSFRLSDVWGGNVYDMGYQDNKRSVYYSDSGSNAMGVYRSNLGNSGGLKITRNDSSAIVGQFYFKGVNAYGQEISIRNGYFKIVKP